MRDLDNGIQWECHIWCKESILSKSCVVALLAELKKAARALGTACLFAARNAVRCDYVSLGVVSPVTCRFMGRKNGTKTDTHHLKLASPNSASEFNDLAASFMTKNVLVMKPRSLIFVREKGPVTMTNCRGVCQ